MKHALVAFGLALSAAGAAHATDVGVSVSISQPGVYGRVDIGRYPQPALVVPQPVVVHRPVHAVQPVYMWVPMEHRKHWHRHCAAYGACGVPVYFVQHGWYRQHVHGPHYRGDGHGHGRHGDHDRDDDDRDDD